MASSVRKVLIGMDGSEYSEYAFEWYTKSLRQENDFVIIIYVSEGNSVLHTDEEIDLSFVSKVLQEEAIYKRMQMKKLEEKLKNAGLNGIVKHAHGKAGECVISTAHDVKADVIICGSRGAGTLRRTFLGSVSDYIVHHSDIPVVVCKHHKHSHYYHGAHHVHIGTHKLSNLLHHDCKK